MTWQDREFIRMADKLLQTSSCSGDIICENDTNNNESSEQQSDNYEQVLSEIRCILNTDLEGRTNNFKSDHLLLKTKTGCSDAETNVSFTKPYIFQSIIPRGKWASCVDCKLSLPPERFICHMCDDFTCTYKVVLYSHLRDQHDILTPTNVKCDICELELNNGKRLFSHILSAHPCHSLHLSCVCKRGNLFKNEVELLVHQNTCRSFLVSSNRSHPQSIKSCSDNMQLNLPVVICNNSSVPFSSDHSVQSIEEGELLSSDAEDIESLDPTRYSPTSYSPTFYRLVEKSQRSLISPPLTSAGSPFEDKNRLPMPRTCQICLFTVSDISYTARDLIHCPHCGLKFLSQVELILHSQQQHSNEFSTGFLSDSRLTCYVKDCLSKNRSFSIAEYFEHRAKKHKSGQCLLHYICPNANCRQLFSEEKSMQQHFHKCCDESSDLKSCEVNRTCRECFHRAELSTLIACESCKLVISNEAEYQIHRLTCNGDEAREKDRPEKLFSLDNCPVHFVCVRSACRMLFSSAVELVSHMYQCEILVSTESTKGETRKRKLAAG